MKKKDYYEKVLKTCSKCGLCQSVCPIYKETGKETIVSRGKFNLILGLIKGDLKYTKKLEKTLDMCLHCNACDDFCPSSIKASEIINFTQNQYKKHCFPFKYNSFFKLQMTILSFIFKLYRVSGLTFLVSKTTKIIEKLGVFGFLFILFDKISKIKVKRKKSPNKSKKTLKVIYFEGCFTKYLNPSVKNAVLNILEKNNVEVVQKNFECCGISALFNGKKDLFEKLKQKNIKLLKEDCDYIVCDCSTCMAALQEYKQDFTHKIIDILELIEIVGAKTFDSNVTYHLPCHLRPQKEKIVNILKETFPNYKEMKDFDTCCGFSGDFSLKYPLISQKISNKKAENAIKTCADVILTSCPGCIIGLNKGLIAKKSTQNVLSVVEFLDINS